MKLLSGVKSQTKPIEIDDFSSQTTVFVRNNIKETIEIDPVFNTESIIYTYDERQYTFPEWNKITTDKLKQNEKALQEQIEIVQLALVEVLDLISTIILSPMNIDQDTDFMDTNGLVPKMDETSSEVSIIAKMYSIMINKGLIDITRVPILFEREVKEYLETNKE